MLQGFCLAMQELEVNHIFSGHSYGQALDTTLLVALVIALIVALDKLWTQL